MSETFTRIRELATVGDVRISEHGYDELAADDLSVRDIMVGVETARVVEDYPDFPKGAAVLVLQADARSNPVHVVWGIPRGYARSAVLVTAYRPDPVRWSANFMERAR